MLSHPSSGSPLWFLICCLTAWRVTMLLCYEAGPFDLFSRLRVGLVRIGLHRLITCFHCTAVWVSAILVVIVYERRPSSALLALALAGAASLIERFLGGKEQPDA